MTSAITGTSCGERCGTVLSFERRATSSTQVGTEKTVEIEILDNPVADIVGWERQFGEREGKFFLATDASIIYEHPSDSRLWLAGRDINQFQTAARAWQTYCLSVAGQPEAKQLEFVAELRAALSKIGVLERPESLWSVWLEQAQDGQL